MLRVKLTNQLIQALLKLPTQTFLYPLAPLTICKGRTRTQHLVADINHFKRFVARQSESFLKTKPHVLHAT